MKWPSEKTRLAVAEDALREIATRMDTMFKTSTVSPSLGDQMTEVRRIAEVALVFSDK